MKPLQIPATEAEATKYAKQLLALEQDHWCTADLDLGYLWPEKVPFRYQDSLHWLTEAFSNPDSQHSQSNRLNSMPQH